MRRSFGANGGMGGGGGMLRTVQRGVRANVGGAAQEPFSHSTATNSSTTTRSTYKPTTSNLLSFSSSTSSSSHLPVSSISNLPTWPGSSSSYPTTTTFSDEFEWECVDGIEDEKGVCAFYDDFVFGSVPSEDEVQNALSSLQQVLDPASFSQFIKDRPAYNSDNNVADEITSPTGLVTRVSSVGTELDWIEPSMQPCNPRMLQRHGSDRVYDAFHLLQTDPSIQRMVVSLSSDKAVWDAVLSNEVVRELRESLSEGSGRQLASAPKLLRYEKKKRKKKVQLEGFSSFARFHGHKAAAISKPTSKSVIFRPAAAAIAHSDLSEDVTSPSNLLLNEAKATLQLGKSLGINFNGKEEDVLNKMIELELQDMERSK